MQTYAQAHFALLAYLAAAGWRMSAPTLKVRHATSPDGTMRLWIRPQAVYFSRSMAGRPHTYADARSIWVDCRSTAPAETVAALRNFT